MPDTATGCVRAPAASLADNEINRHVNLLSVRNRTQKCLETLSSSRRDCNTETEHRIAQSVTPTKRASSDALTGAVLTVGKVDGSVDQLLSDDQQRTVWDLYSVSKK